MKEGNPIKLSSVGYRADEAEKQRVIELAALYGATDQSSFLRDLVRAAEEAVKDRSVELVVKPFRLERYPKGTLTERETENLICLTYECAERLSPKRITPPEQCNDLTCHKRKKP